MTDFKLSIIAAIVAALLAWQVQDWRYTSQIQEMQLVAEKAANEANEKHRETERVLNEKIQAAEKNAADREAIIRADANSARVSNDRLRDELARLRSGLSTDTRSTLVERASTLSELFENCTVRYRELAESADRHVNDKQKLIEAWPKQ